MNYTIERLTGVREWEAVVSLPSYQQAWAALWACKRGAPEGYFRIIPDREAFIKHATQPLRSSHAQGNRQPLDVGPGLGPKVG